MRVKKSSHTNHGNKATKAIITECAWAASRTKDTFIAGRYGRLTARRCKKRALVATAHELLTIVYHVLKDQVIYNELGCGYVDERRKNARIKYHMEVLKNLGVDIPRALGGNRLTKAKTILRSIASGTPSPIMKLTQTN